MRQQQAEGADFIKAALVTPPVFFAAQAEAKRIGLPITGHLPRRPASTFRLPPAAASHPSSTSVPGSRCSPRAPTTAGCGTRRRRSATPDCRSCRRRCFDC